MIETLYHLLRKCNRLHTSPIRSRKRKQAKSVWDELVQLLPNARGCDFSEHAKKGNGGQGWTEAIAQLNI